MKDKQGFTLVEILIAIFVLGIGLLGILTLFPVGLDATRNMLANSRASMIASSARATLAAMHAHESVLDWQQLNQGHAQKDGPWYYPHDDEVFAPDEPPQAVKDAGHPYSFIEGDDNDDNVDPGLQVVESGDNPLFAFNVIVGESSTPTLTGKQYSLRIVGTVPGVGSEVRDYSPSPLPKMDVDDDQLGMNVDSVRIDSYGADSIFLKGILSTTGQRVLTVRGKLHLQAKFGYQSDKAIVSADTANGWYWPDELKVGDYLKAPDDKWYRVAGINWNNQTLYMSKPYGALSETATALIASPPGANLSAQIVVFRNRDIVASEERGELSKAATGCLVQVVYGSRQDYNDSALKPVRLRPGDHLALLRSHADPTDPDDLHKHGFWYEIARFDVTEDAITGQITVEMALEQPEAKVTEAAGSYDFVVTRSIVGLYETSLGQ